MRLTYYEFWCWKPKLQGVLQLLCVLSGYSFSATDAETISYGLHATSEIQHQRFAYDLSASNGPFHISLALDEDDHDIVFEAV